MLRVRAICCLLFAALVPGPAAAANEPARTQFKILNNVDLAGSDYRNPSNASGLQDIGVAGCQAACASDRRCKAFTYNQSAGWCFLKSSGTSRNPYNGAVSGIKQATPARTVRRGAYDPTAIAAQVRRMLNGYMPATPLRQQAGMAAAFDEDRRMARQLLSPVEGGAVTIDASAFIDRPKPQYSSNDGIWLLTGVSSLDPQLTAVVSQQHRRIIRFIAEAQKYDTKVTRAEVENAVARLQRMLAEFRRKHGRTHPLTGFLIADIASLTALRIADEQERKTARELSSELHLVAYNLLRQPVLAPARIQRSMAENAISNLLRGVRGAGCQTSDPVASDYARGGAEVSEYFRSAAALHFSRFGPQARQIGWLRAAALCAEDSGRRRKILRARTALARGLNDAWALVGAYGDLAIAQWRAGRADQARRSFREAIRIYNARLKSEPAQYEFYHLYDWGSGTFAVHLDVLADLGLDRELDLLIAKMIDGAVQKPDDYNSRAGQSQLAFIGQLVEKRGMAELADNFHAFTSKIDAFGDSSGGLETTPVAEPAIIARMLQLAEQALDSEDFDKASPILNRALGKAERIKAPDSIFAVLSLLTRLHHEKGDLDKATGYARRALKLAQRSGLDRSRFSLGELEAIATGPAGSGDADPALAALTAVLERETAKACDAAAPKPNLLPALPVDEIAADPYLAEGFFKSRALSDYLECFTRLRGRMAGMVPPKADAVQPEIVFDVMFVLTLADDRETALEHLAFLFDRAVWNTNKSGRYVRFAILAAAIKGILANGRRDWTMDYVERLKQEIAPYMHDLSWAHKGGYPVTQAMDLGLTLHSIGETELVGRIHAAAKAWLAHQNEQPFYGNNDCVTFEVCEFMSLLERARGSRKLADKYLASLSNKFLMAWSGASMDPHEEDAIKARALSVGLRRERAGLFRLAAVYYAIAGNTVDDILKSDAPLRSFDGIQAADALSRIAYKTGDLATARRVTNHLVSAAQKRIDGLATFGSDLLIRWSQRLRGIFETQLNTAPVNGNGVVEGGDAEFLAMQYLQATRTAVTFTKLSTRMGRNGSKVAREHQDVTTALSEAYGRLGGAKASAADRLLRQIGTLEDKARSLESRLREENPAYFQHGRLQFVTLKGLQGYLKPGEAVLSSFAGEDHAYLWLITRKRHSLRRLNVKPEALARTITALRAKIGADSASPDIDALLRVPVLKFHQLYRTVLGGFKAQLTDVTQLIFVPHGAFDGLPIATLLTEMPSAPTMSVREVRDAKLPWLIRQMAISVMPSLGSIRVLRQAGAVSPAERPFLGLGNPRFGDGLFVAPAPTRALDPKLVAMAPLPETETEVTRLAEILGADPDRDLLLADAASETRLKQSPLERYRIIALASHGLLAGEVRGLDEPAIVLAKPDRASARDDGLLTASEVLDLRLNADLVILSACNTASSDGRPGAEGLSGLANAFFYAGARNLIVTHWYIPSLAAVEVTVGMMRARGSEPTLDWAQALRRSLLQLIDGDGPVGYAHPRSWGAHIVVGVAN